MIDRRVFLLAVPAAGSIPAEWLLDEASAARLAVAPLVKEPPGTPKPGRTIAAGGDGGVEPVAVKSEGPGLRVVAPSRARVANPFDLHLTFVPRGYAPDPATLGLRVSVWTPAGYRGDEDLSPRIRRYANAEGLRMPPHRLPKRRYRFQLAIADVTGRASQWRFEIEVTG